MNKINIYCAKNKIYTKLIINYFKSIFPKNCITINADLNNTDILVLCTIDNYIENSILSWLKNKKNKLIIFGEIPSDLLSELDISVSEFSSHFEKNSKAFHAKKNYSSDSINKIIYTNLSNKIDFFECERSFQRYDFVDEWNNQGYRFIDNEFSTKITNPYSIPKSNEIAYVHDSLNRICSYAGIFDFKYSSVIWFNRRIGPLDSFECILLENFISSYRHEDNLYCVPSHIEIPYGFDSLISVRFDCDEEISSLKYIFDFYNNQKIPISLAIHDNSYNSVRDDLLIKQVLDNNGALLSHSISHPHNWGGDYNSALHEGLNSKKNIEERFNVRVDYAVSPFHETPEYAVKALKNSGYKGCIGGSCVKNDAINSFRSIKNYDDFILSSHSSMLHGDCLLNKKDKIENYKKAFDYKFMTHGLFGYLDHPFSERYSYGWISEKERISYHKQLIDYIKLKAQKPLFLNLNDALNFIDEKTNIDISIGSNNEILSINSFGKTHYNHVVNFCGSLEKI